VRKLVLLTLAVTALAAAQAAARPAKSIKVGDDYFVRKGSTPTVTVKKGTTVTWRFRGNDIHNIAVTKGPVKFHSAVKDSGSFSKKMRRAGRYTIVCTIHSGMKMKLRVTR
jgi:plastocyanin